MDGIRSNSALLDDSITTTSRPRRLTHEHQNVTPGLVCLMIAIALERITFYIVTTNMTDFFFSQMNLKDSSRIPITTYLVFVGTSDFLPLFGGVLGNSLISSYACTVIGFLIESAGSIFLLILMVIDDRLPEPVHVKTATDYGLLFPGLILMVIGLGFQRANILIVGCKQVCQRTDQNGNVKAVEKFFRGYYWVSNVGSLIAFAVTAIAKSPNVNHTRKHAPTYYLGIIQTVSVILSTFFVIIGKRWYIRTTPNSDNLRKFTRAFFRKISSFFRYFRRKRHSSLSGFQASRDEHRAENELFKHIFEIILVAACLIMFQILFSLELGDIFFQQGLVMNYHVGNVTIPIVLMPGFDSITIIIVLPIIHFVITPCLVQMDRGVLLLKRMGGGLLFGCASALACGTVETVRHKYYISCSKTCFSIFWQIPQFVFLSLGEIFAFITSYQFMYLESPPNLQGMTLGIQFCLRGLASYLARALLAIVEAAAPAWYPTTFNTGNVEKFLFLLAGLQMLFFLIYLWYAYRYRYKYLCSDEEDSARTPLCPNPIQTQSFHSYSTLGSLSTNSLGSLDSIPGASD